MDRFRRLIGLKKVDDAQKPKKGENKDLKKKNPRQALATEAGPAKRSAIVNEGVPQKINVKTATQKTGVNTLVQSKEPANPDNNEKILADHIKKREYSAAFELLTVDMSGEVDLNYQVNNDKGKTKPLYDFFIEAVARDYLQEKDRASIQGEDWASIKKLAQAFGRKLPQISPEKKGDASDFNFYGVHFIAETGSVELFNVLFDHNTLKSKGFIGRLRPFSALFDPETLKSKGFIGRFGPFSKDRVNEEKDGRFSKDKVNEEKDDRAPLHIAIWAHKVEMVEFLYNLQKTVKYNNLLEEASMALNKAAFSGKSEDQVGAINIIIHLLRDGVKSEEQKDEQKDLDQIIPKSNFVTKQLAAAREKASTDQIKDAIRGLERYIMQNKYRPTHLEAIKSSLSRKVDVDLKATSDKEDLDHADDSDASFDLPFDDQFENQDDNLAQSSSSLGVKLVNDCKVTDPKDRRKVEAKLNDGTKVETVEQFAEFYLEQLNGIKGDGLKDKIKDLFESVYEEDLLLVIEAISRKQGYLVLCNPNLNHASQNVVFDSFKNLFDNNFVNCDTRGKRKFAELVNMTFGTDKSTAIELAISNKNYTLVNKLVVALAISVRSKEKNTDSSQSKSKKSSSDQLGVSALSSSAANAGVAGDRDSLVKKLTDSIIAAKKDGSQDVRKMVTKALLATEPEASGIDFGHAFLALATLTTRIEYIKYAESNPTVVQEALNSVFNYAKESNDLQFLRDFVQNFKNIHLAGQKFLNEFVKKIEQSNDHDGDKFLTQAARADLAQSFQTFAKTASNIENESRKGVPANTHKDPSDDKSFVGAALSVADLNTSSSAEQTSDLKLAVPQLQVVDEDQDQDQDFHPLFDNKVHKTSFKERPATVKGVGSNTSSTDVQQVEIAIDPKSSVSGLAIRSSDVSAQDSSSSIIPFQSVTRDKKTTVTKASYIDSGDHKLSSVKDLEGRSVSSGDQARFLSLTPIDSSSSTTSMDSSTADDKEEEVPNPEIQSSSQSSSSKKDELSTNTQSFAAHDSLSTSVKLEPKAAALNQGSSIPNSGSSIAKEDSSAAKSSIVAAPQRLVSQTNSKQKGATKDSVQDNDSESSTKIPLLAKTKEHELLPISIANNDESRSTGSGNPKLSVEDLKVESVGSGDQIQQTSLLFRFKNLFRREKARQDTNSDASAEDVNGQGEKESIQPNSSGKYALITAQSLPRQQKFPLDSSELPVHNSGASIAGAPSSDSQVAPTVKAGGITQSSVALAPQELGSQITSNQEGVAKNPAKVNDDGFLQKKSLLAKIEDSKSSITIANNSIKERYQKTLDERYGDFFQKIKEASKNTGAPVIDTERRKNILTNQEPQKSDLFGAFVTGLEKIDAYGIREKDGANENYDEIQALWKGERKSLSDGSIKRISRELDRLDFAEKLALFLFSCDPNSDFYKEVINSSKPQDLLSGVALEEVDKIIRNVLDNKDEVKAWTVDTCESMSPSVAVKPTGYKELWERSLEALVGRGW